MKPVCREKEGSGMQNNNKIDHKEIQKGFLTVRRKQFHNWDFSSSFFSLFSQPTKSEVGTDMITFQRRKRATNGFFLFYFSHVLFGVGNGKDPPVSHRPLRKLQPPHSCAWTWRKLHSTSEELNGAVLCVLLKKVPKTFTRKRLNRTDQRWCPLLHYPPLLETDEHTINRQCWPPCICPAPRNIYMYIDIYIYQQKVKT